MALLGYFFALIISFYLLAEISDRYFIPALDQIAKRFNMSHDMAGATLMAIGSSAPELFVSIIALVMPGDHKIIGLGTIVGSALFNLLVIIGAAAIVRTAVLSWQPVVRDLLFYALSIAMLFYVLSDGIILWWEALILIVFYGGYILAVVNWRNLFPYEDKDQIDTEEEESEVKTGWKRILVPLDFLLDKLFPPSRYYFANFFISIILIAGLCWILVEGSVGISIIINIPEVVIAITVLAVGTSVPDMVSSVIVAKQGRGGMAVSNAVGSNIFDIFIGLGLPWFVYILVTGSPITESGTEAGTLSLSMFLLFASALFIFIALWIKKWKIDSKIGYTLIVIYLLYLMWEVSKIYFF